jgi:hypothetical protein
MKKKVEPVKVYDTDIEELAVFILGLDEESDPWDIDHALYEEFECTLESFGKIIQHLLPLCDVGKSPLTGEKYRGFSDREGECWLIKTEA